MGAVCIVESGGLILISIVVLAAKKATELQQALFSPWSVSHPEVHLFAA